MAAPPPPFKSAPPDLTQRVQEGKEEEPTPRPPQELNDLISTLPRVKDWAPIMIRKYQGFWLPEHTLRGIMAIHEYFSARAGDLILASHPKSGTTWLKALSFAVVTRTQYPLGDHPLLSLNPHDLVPLMEGLFAAGQASKIEAIPSPRVLSTHTPFSLLPVSMVTGSDCRVIYVCRDPKDVLVSAWHFGEKMRLGRVESLPFSKAFELFHAGTCPFGPIWDHVLEYWRESSRRPEKVLFLKYEEMLEDPAKQSRRLAEFAGCPFSKEEEKEGMVEEIVKLCSLEQQKSLEVNKKGNQESAFHVTNASFFRKGAKGDWRNHLSPEMAQKLDQVIQQKLEGSGLTLATGGGSPDQLQ